MNVERNLPVIRERKLAILKGDAELCAQLGIEVPAN